MTKFQKVSKNIQQLTINNPKNPQDKIEWINIANAGRKELEYLRKKYGFAMRHLHPSFGKSLSQRLIMEEGDDYLFLILQFPIKQGESIINAEIDFFLGHGFLITLHNNNLDTLNNFFNLSKKDGESLLSYQIESSSILLYELLQKLMGDCFSLIDQAGVAISDLESMIFDQRKEKRAVSKILVQRRNITNFRKIMQNHKNILKKLSEMESSLAPKEILKNRYNNLIEQSKKIWEALESQKEMIEIFHDTNESLMNNRLNDIMKTLTIFSVIVFPLTLFAAIFGMNTVNGMPFVDSENGFWMIMSIMSIGCLLMLLIFWRKKWL